MKLVYLDNHATTQVDPKVFEEMLPYFTKDFGNPSSERHPYGWKAQEAVLKAKKQISNLLNANEDNIFFTSGATESIYTTIVGQCRTRKNYKIAYSTIEHKATLESISFSKKYFGCEAYPISVTNEGVLNPSNLLKFLTEKKIDLLSVIHGNNEIGSINDISLISKICKQANCLLHIDAAQTFGKILIDLHLTPVDFLSFSGHKIYGPKGIGGLYVTPDVPQSFLFDGGSGYQKQRSGTLNIPGIVGLGKAAEISQNEILDNLNHTKNLRNYFEKKLLSLFPNCHINGAINDRLPGNINITFKDISSSQILRSLHNVAHSSASACSTDFIENSHVLTEIGLSKNQIKSTIRFGLGRFNTKEDIEYTLEKLQKITTI